ncbi:hypothetical protein MLD38_037725 [Melastoma candidum]|uniref:Uncharacterized protein n=1 Tax=Melastoma candidum TaxID=119954 RepID=A0ACB9LN57_9MYRT|nr:hypothetical protein MLD38_037725 [Melastoma candidum]
MLQELRGLPTSLTELDVSHCPLDKGIPEEIGSLLALEYLVLSGSKIRFLPETISRLPRLKSLILHDCDMFQELPRLPTSLAMLTFSSKSLRAVPNLAVLTNITQLKLSDGIDCTKDYEGEHLELSGLGSLEKLKRLDLRPSRMITFNRASELGSLSKLETLDLSFPDMASISELPSCLRMLTLRHLRTAIPWERYSNLMLLTELKLMDFTLTDIDFGGLDSLPSLTTLSIGPSESLLRVSNLGRLRAITSLWIHWCEELMEIPGLEQLERLERLNIRLCGSICGIQDLLGLNRLKMMEIWCCSSWLCVPRMIDQCRLHISRCGKLPSFDGTYSEYGRMGKPTGDVSRE